MDKKKVIIIVVVFLLLGTMIYSFASKPSDQLEQPNDNPPVEDDGQTDQGETPSDEDSEKPSDEDETPIDEQPEEDLPVSGDDEVVPDTTDYLALAQEAVAKAESSLTQTDVDKAMEAIKNVADEDTTELVDRITDVQNIIDFETLLTQLENKTNSATSKDELDAVRADTTTTDALDKIVNNLSDVTANADKVSDLTNRYEDVLAKLEDTEPPKVEGINNGDFVNTPIKLTINDDASFTATLSKDGGEASNYVTGDDITLDGEYVLTVIDSLYNKQEIKFVINTTEPTITLPTLKEDIFTNVGTINVTDDIEFEVVVTLDGETEDTITATVQTDGTYLAALDLTQYGKGEYTITATDKAGNTVTSATFDFDATGALVTNIDELNTALSDNTIETIYLNNDITDLTSRVVVNRAVTINGNNHKLTFTDAINTATYGERQGIVVTTNDVVINDLTVEMDAVQDILNRLDENWDGVYAIQVYNGTATLNNVTATKADGGIFANSSTVTLTGTIDVSGNEFGGIEVSNGNPVLNATEATLVNTTEEFRKPTIWTDKTPNAVVNVKDMVENKFVKDEQVQYYLNENNIEGSEMATNVNDIYTSNDLSQPTSITPNASATITVYKSYTNIRFKVENIITPDGANVKVWAQDTNGNIWDMITAGWGPEAGFPVEAGYTATTPFQITVDKVGSYSADIVLYDVLTNEEISRQEIKFTASYKTNINGVDYVFENYNDLFEQLPSDVQATVVLQNNIEEEIIIPENKDIVLDLNNNTITGNVAITNNGTLSIVNGTIVTDNNAIINNGTIAEIDNVVINSEWIGINNKGTIEKIYNTNIDARRYPIILTDAKIGELDNNTVTGHYQSGIYLKGTSRIDRIISGSYVTYGDKPESGNSVSGFGLYIGSSSSIGEIAGGTFQGNQVAVANYGDIDLISGGLFEKKFPNDIWKMTYTFGYSGEIGSITGGKFYSYNGKLNGVFRYTKQNTIAEGYEFVQEGDYFIAQPQI